MQQTQQANEGGGSSEPRSASELLAVVKAEIARFDARKLGELKTALEGFVKKQGALVADYEQAFPELKKLWMKQQESVGQLHKSLQGSLPDGKWKEGLSKCVCEKQREIRCKEEKIWVRKRCFQGELERKRDRAKEKSEAAKRHLDGLIANQKSLEAGLKQNDKMVRDIYSLMSTDIWQAAYLFWFKLLPLHRAMTPPNVKCPPVGEGEAPEDICSEVEKTPCEPEPCGCQPPKKEEPGKQETHTTLPAMLDPKQYQGVLDSAWLENQRAREEASEAELALQREPDDIASLEKALEQEKKSLEEKIKECLGKQPGPFPCRDDPTKDEPCPPEKDDDPCAPVEPPDEPAVDQQPPNQEPQPPEAGATGEPGPPLPNQYSSPGKETPASQEPKKRTTPGKAD